MSEHNVVKRTSGRYRLVFIHPRTSQIVHIFCDQSTGKIEPFFPARKPSGTDLTVLDQYILENITNESSLRQLVLSLGYQISKDFVPRISYQHDQTTRYLELVYQSKQLSTMAELCRQYKSKYATYIARKTLSSGEIRQLISNEISKETVWKEFYKNVIAQIHIPEFYFYLFSHPLVNKRTLKYIFDYLKNEKAISREQQEAFQSAKYQLINMFTSYKPIRGMIICQSEYFSANELNNHELSIRTEDDKLEILKKCEQWSDIFSLLTNEQMEYLESHPQFDCMTQEEQEEIVFSALEIPYVPWYEKIDIPISESQITYLEKHDAFNRLPYLKKIDFVNSILSEQISSYKTKSFK